MAGGGACAPRQCLLDDGFGRELDDVLGGKPHWHQLVSSGQRSLAGQLGAIWSVFVIGVASHA
ncbi:hypothetical protein [Janthinobacterium sp. HLX7-2]|uniref:hypothetical protein n=1 Tax=Janthinobacterium sp. HLX7-2 TaxID=1259331 RepID=UPI003F2632C9